VYPEDREPGLAVRQLQGDVAIEAAGTEQSGIEHVRTVGRGEHDDRLVAFKAVQLGQNLVEGLFTFVMSAAIPCATDAADTVEFIDEDNARRALLGILKELTNARGADADE
jgi:hypothetical protein